MMVIDIAIIAGPCRFVRITHPNGLGISAWEVYRDGEQVGAVWVDCTGSLDWDLPADVSQLLADSPDADRIKDALRDYSKK